MRGQEMKKRTKEIEVFGEKFVIRRMGVVDFLACGVDPDLMNKLEQAQIEPTSAQSAHTFARARELMNKVVCRGVKTPVLSIDTKALNSVHDLTYEEVDAIANQIFVFAGLSEEAAESIAPLSETNTEQTGNVKD